MDSQANDTSQIVQLIFASKQIDNHLIPSKLDSIYLVKNKYVNASWPGKSNRFIISYIDDSAKARKPNPLNSNLHDKRIRLIVPAFTIQNDSAKVILYNFNFGSDIKYWLKKNKNWEIIKTSKGME